MYFGRDPEPVDARRINRFGRHIRLRRRLAAFSLHAWPGIGVAVLGGNPAEPLDDEPDDHHDQAAASHGQGLPGDLLVAAQVPQPQLLHHDSRVPAQQDRAGVGAGLGEDQGPGSQDGVEDFLLLAVAPPEHADAQHQREDHDHAHGHQARQRQHRGGQAVAAGEHGGEPAGHGQDHANGQQEQGAGQLHGRSAAPGTPVISVAVTSAAAGFWKPSKVARSAKSAAFAARSPTRSPLSSAAGSISDHG